MASGPKKKTEQEVEAINRFIGFLKDLGGTAYYVLDEDVVVDPVTGSNYDYQLSEVGKAVPAIAVEIFRLVENEEDLAAERHRGMLWEAIKREFAAAGLVDLLVITPDQVGVLPRDGTKFAKTLARIAFKELSEHPKAEELQLEGGFAVKRIPGLGLVACASHSNPRWIDGVGIATPPLIKSLLKKDSQLAVSGLERVILCVNWAWAVDSDDAANAIALIDTSELQYVDRVYFDSGKSHKLIYARSVRDGLPGGRIPPDDPEEARLFEQSLALRLEKEIPGAFERVRQISEHTGGISWIKNRHRREAVVRAAQKRVQSGDIGAGLWVVASAKDDPDPPLTNYPDDPEGTFNYHEQVKRGEDAFTSTGVRASVCWLIQTLVCKSPEQCWQLIYTVEKLGTGENLHVRQNACVPLIEFAVRRNWRRDGSHIMPEEVRERTKRLAFTMLRENCAYSTILDWLAPAFFRMPDLDEGEVREVLDTLLERTSKEGLTSVAHFLVFFAVFRSGHPNFPDPFDSSFAKSRLEESLKQGRPELRHAIAFTFFKTVEEDARLAKALRRYILMLPDVGLTGHAPNFFYEMAQALIDGPDHEVENAIIKMVSEEARWATEARGRFLALLKIVPLLKKLAEHERWATVLGASKAIAAARHTVLGGTSELSELLKRAPADFSDQAEALRLGNELT